MNNNYLRACIYHCAHICCSAAVVWTGRCLAYHEGWRFSGLAAAWRTTRGGGFLDRPLLGVPRGVAVFWTGRCLAYPDGVGVFWTGRCLAYPEGWRFSGPAAAWRTPTGWGFSGPAAAWRTTRGGGFLDRPLLGVPRGVEVFSSILSINRE